MTVKADHWFIKLIGLSWVFRCVCLSFMKACLDSLHLTGCARIFRVAIDLNCSFLGMPLLGTHGTSESDMLMSAYVFSSLHKQTTF